MTKKKKRAVAPPPRLLESPQTSTETKPLGSGSYSSEALAALRNAQTIKVDFKPKGSAASVVSSLPTQDQQSLTDEMLIPDEREISKAKAAREAKRLKLSSSTASALPSSTSLEKDYMALDVTDTKKVYR